MDRRFFVKSSSLFVLSLASAKMLSSCGANSTSTNTVEATEARNAAEIEEINFGIISTESQANQKPIWEPFIEAMSAELGIPVKAFYATQYAGVIEAMAAGKVDVAWFGGKSYIEAVERANAEAFALTVADDGSKGYYSHLITNADNPLVKDVNLEAGDGDKYVIENASNLTFAFNDVNSTSGFLVPSYYVFAQNSVNPNEAFERLVFAGNHEAAALVVANNQVDVATNNNESLSRLEKTNPEAREKIQVIWTSPEIPSDPIAYRQNLPEAVKENIRNFFYNYEDEAVLGPLEWSGFEETDDSRWNTIRELEIAKQILEVESNESLSAEDKQQQIDELNKQLDALKS
ncbi:MAG: phosphonate ABC transporter substrate-binding protein [Spirulinaceae cyanobacterium]